MEATRALRSDEEFGELLGGDVELRYAGIDGLIQTLESLDADGDKMISWDEFRTLVFPEPEQDQAAAKLQSRYRGMSLRKNPPAPARDPEQDAAAAITEQVFTHHALVNGLRNYQNKETSLCITENNVSAALNRTECLLIRTSFSRSNDDR